MGFDQFVDEAAERVATAIYENTERTITEVMAEDLHEMVAKHHVDGAFADALEARMRQSIAASLAMKFMSSVTGWGELLESARVRYYANKEKEEE